MRIKMNFLLKSDVLVPKSRMERLAYQSMLDWKNRSDRKPMLIDGARQTGKTYLVENIFGEREFRRIHKLDFLENPRLSDVFEGDLHPDALLDRIELALGRDIDQKHDLIFFDEVGECERALSSLKFFAERRPDLFLCASGSNLGLMRSFPVGKVELLELFPICFEEFVIACGSSSLIDAFKSQVRNPTVHNLLWDILCDYYFVGGMPEAVAAWIEAADGMNARIQRISEIQQAILEGYIRDFGKYDLLIPAFQIEAVFRNVASQLAQNVDVSVQRYRFNEALPNRNRYTSLRGPITWLEKARLLWKCGLISSRPNPPLAALAKENVFKLYLFDVGILGNLLGLTYADHRKQDLTYKGFYAENFFVTEYRARVSYPMYCWQQARAEIEFLHRSQDGSIYPVEVKSGKRTRAKSLGSYIDRFQPKRALKFANVQERTHVDRTSTWPLYDVQFLRQL